MLSLCIYYNYLLIDNCVGLFKNYYITICSMPTYMYRIIQVFKKNNFSHSLHNLHRFLLS